jgi:hypothetical protein
MSVPRSIVMAITLLAGLCASCASIKSINAPLEGPAWENFGEGTTTLGLSSGWAFAEGVARASGQSGVLEGETGTDTAALTPRYGGGLKLSHMITDSFGLGAVLEYRSFTPDPLSPLSATLTAGDFETLQFVASMRYFLEGWGETKSWRPFLGLDLSYVPEVDLGAVDVNYPVSDSGDDIPDETVNVSGTGYWTLAPVVGFSYLVYDNLAFDIGAFYEYAITPSQATVEFQNLNGATAEMALRPRGLFLSAGLTYAF